MEKGLKRALEVIDIELGVAKQYSMPIMVMGIEQIKTLLQDELDAQSDTQKDLSISKEETTNVSCGLITCIYNNGKRVCSNKNLELNYFDDYSIFKDEKIPNTETKITDYLSTHIGHFMGVQCRDFKMDKYKVMQNPKNG